MATLLCKGDHEARFLTSQNFSLIKKEKRMGNAGDTYLHPSACLQGYGYALVTVSEGRNEVDVELEALLPASTQKFVLSVFSPMFRLHVTVNNHINWMYKKVRV